MQLHISTSYEEMSQAAARFIASYVSRHPEALLCMPSGDTPTGTFRHLIGLVQSGEADLSRCRFVGLDEWVGMNKGDEGSCGYYLYTQLFGPLGISPDKAVFFNGRAAHLDKECRRVDRYVRENGPIGLMLVGIGMNGHIGLNEPGVSFDHYSHTVVLDVLTQAVAQKYFKHETALHEGITLGLRHLTEAGTAVLIANGARKASIVAEALQGEVTDQVPASILQLHPDGHAFLDGEAATLLRNL